MSIARDLKVSGMKDILKVMIKNSAMILAWNWYVLQNFKLLETLRRTKRVETHALWKRKE